MTFRVLYLMHEYLPYYVSGAGVSTHVQCEALLSRGNAVAVLAESSRRATFRGRIADRVGSLFSKNAAGCDTVMGYPVYRRVDAETKLGEVLDAWQPDLVVIQPAGLRAHAAETLSICERRGVPLVLYFLALQAFWRRENALDFEQIRKNSILTNSRFMAGELKRRLSLDILPQVVFPIVPPERYRVEPLRKNVVFVNPVAMKGADVAIELAKRRPDIDFLFVEAWRPSGKDQALRAECRHLPNIRWQKPVSDMRSVYRQARIVLAPTPKQEGFVVEAWGRTATEAQVSGIPVIATAECGFEESVGPGGMLVNWDAGIDAWQEALSRLWDDENEYRKYCDAAKEYSEREEIDPEVLTDRLCEFYQSVVESR